MISTSLEFQKNIYLDCESIAIRTVDFEFSKKIL